jgi:signal transduction histidine kinase/sensor domain CHASE-containing protein/CheY-like chemotaxis protein
MHLSSLRTRTLLVVATPLVLLIVCLLALSDQIVSRGFRAAEERSVYERMELVQNALDNNLTVLSRVTADYAVWDDTYVFVTNPDPEYIAGNFVSTTYVNNNLSYMAALDSSGAIVYAESFDLATGNEVPVPPELRDLNGPLAHLLQHDGPTSGIAGLIMLDAGPMLVASRPVLTSIGEGPPTGTLIMGLMLDDHEIARLSTITRLPIAVTPLGAPALSAELQGLASQLEADRQLVSAPLSPEQIVGVTRMSGLGDEPGVLVQVTLPRDAYQSGRAVVRTYTFALLGVGILVGALVLWLLERTVLVRLTSLHDQVRLVGSEGNASSRVVVRGDDEIGHLSSAINQMLDGLAGARQRITASEARYRQLVELTPDAIIVHDSQDVRYSNPAAAALFGAGDPEAMVGQPVDPAIAAVAPSLNGVPVVCDQSLVVRGGEQIEVELVALPFHDQDDSVTQVIVRNITARKQTEAALREARDAADAANRAKSQFLANMSHELRTPLTAIIGYAELLDRELSPTADETVRYDLGAIRSASAHLLALINNVLDLSRIEAGRMPMQLEYVALPALLKGVSSAVRSIALQNQNQLTIEEPAGAPLLYTDPIHVSQILINLLGNACKFTEGGSVTLRVRMDEPPGHSPQVHFAVIDTGIGVSAEQLALLFDDFVQADVSSTRKYGGTGLGLSLSRRLARMLGGDISAVSMPGVGSTFTFSLPMRFAGPAAKTDEAQVAAGPAPVSVDEPQLALLIDGDPATGELLPRAVGSRELHVEVTDDGAEGLELARALLPDLILLATPARGLEARDVLTQLKAAPETARIPVLLLVSNPALGQVLSGEAAEVLEKPLDIQQLWRAMSASLGVLEAQ